MDALFQPVANLKGIGAKRAEALAKLGIQTPYDLLYHVPRSYLDYSHPVPGCGGILRRDQRDPGADRA